MISISFLKVLDSEIDEVILSAIQRNMPSFDQLKHHARKIRKHVVEMVARHGQGYVQQGLGAADLFTYLYFHEMLLQPENLRHPHRDRFILSTAHNTAVFYATLAERGLLKTDHLQDYCLDGSALEINASERLEGLVECTCGSLGQGLSVACGLALGFQKTGNPARVFVMLGDGELEEGQLWEAVLFAATHKLKNLILIIDLNYMQVEGDARNVARIDPVDEKFTAFGWHALVADGHDFEHIFSLFSILGEQVDMPVAIIAHTIPGKGVDFLEGQKSHNMVLPADVAKKARHQLEVG